ncbi:hypothetical protein HME9302_01193 [Alteripontixanthobacter maritimus]|uniref:Putative Flp pilus-assembly TadG-like N-terminal domain-containing protein n=1 Tax=Alteripontixanthobacter maritimus TaxID=2161824 RepID=A0A369Q8W6_9SPHN|nr:TadE/TadG family type IV pilus assembly protein [Alteripontixanthobacter maritimus]RDC59995.1 hypothetical protein HME9302_01193 [Alteripontixanthobacter maritimus]
MRDTKDPTGRTADGAYTDRGVLRALRDNGGNVLPMAAMGMLVLAGMVGGGVDASRAYMVKSRLQAACDAGVLAGRKSVTNDGFDTAAETNAETYFETNFEASEVDIRNVSFSATSDDGGSTIVGTATTEVEAYVMPLFGFDTVPLSTTCSATMQVGNNDVTLVLDTTGSMACLSSHTASQCQSYINSSGYSETAHGGKSRLQELREALSSFYTVTTTAAAGGQGRVRFGFVPYSSSVNVGNLLVNIDANYVADSHGYQSREYDPAGGSVLYSSNDNGQAYYYSSQAYGSRSSCENAMPDNTAWRDVGSDVDYRTGGRDVTRQQQRRTEFFCFYNGDDYYIANRYQYRYEYLVDHYKYVRRTFNTDLFKNGATVGQNVGNQGSNVNAKWSGCIEEAESTDSATFSFSTITGFSPGGANDLDIDLIPSGPSTQWKPVWPEVSYYRDAGTTESRYGNKTGDPFCPNEAAELQEWEEGDFSSPNSFFNGYIGDLSPAGSTYHDIGMIWGGRMASPDGVFNGSVMEGAANPGTTSRHIVFMTDGFMSTSSNSYSAYGIERNDERVGGADDPARDARHDSRFLAVCEAVKSKGIRVWVIAFSTALTDSLKKCSSPNSAFPASDASQLNDAFQQIGQTIGELRVVQ